MCVVCKMIILSEVGGEKAVHENMLPCILLNQQQIRFGFFFFLQIMNL